MRTTAAALRQASRNPLRVRERVAKHPLVFAGIAAGGAALLFATISGSRRRRKDREAAAGHPQRGFLAGILASIASSAAKVAAAEAAKRYVASRQPR